MRKKEIIILVIIIYINCDGSVPDCSDCNIDTCSNCGSQCKPIFSDPATGCKYCNLEENQYYIINDEGNCIGKSSCGENEKIFYGSKQCISSLANFYIMGDYCYLEVPANSNCDSYKQCNCQNKYYITTTSDSKKEYHCLSQGEACPERFNYYISNECLTDNVQCSGKKKKIEYRNNGSTIYRCSNECNINEILLSNDYCVDDCVSLGKKNYYPNSENTYILKCIDDCSSIHLKELNNKCIPTCPSTNQYYNELNNKCVTSCDSGFIDLNNNCLSESDSTSCYSSSDETVSPKKCYSSCLDISTNHIYETNKVCSTTECEFHTDNLGVKKCFSSRGECFNENYKYFKGKICLKECDGFINGEAEENTPIDCFIDQTDCKNQGFYFYTSFPKKCYHSCPSGLYPNFLEDSKPKEDNTGSTCSDCSSNYSKLSKGYCKEKCDEDECFYQNEPKICKSINDNFYYRDGEKKICVNNCQSISKYHFEGKKECLNTCKSQINPENFVYYDSSNKCVEICNGYAEKPLNDHKECKDTISDNFYYVNDGKKIIINSCNNYISLSDPKKCVSNCENDDEKLDRKTCVNTCSNSERPNFGKKQITVTNENGEITQININICVAQCSELDLNFYIPEKKQCVDICNSNDYYIINNKCYKKCEGANRFINPYTFICSGNCPDSLNFHRKISDNYPEIYFCVEDCNNNEFYLNNECLSQCPDNFNKIGKDRKCKAECQTEDGQYKKKVATLESYSIYKCINSCSFENGIYQIEESKECLNSCPEPLNYVKKGDFKCLSNCPDSDPFYLDNIKDENGHFICSNDFQCESGKYFLNGKCLTIEECKGYGKYFVDPKKICVDNCNNYNYKEEIEDGFYQCTNICDSDKYIIEPIPGCTDNCIGECVKNCPKTLKYVGKDNKCKFECGNLDGLFFHQLKQFNDYKTYQCINICDPETFNLKTNDESDKECYNQCPENFYLSPEEKICYNNCLNSENYKFTLTKTENGITRIICSDSCKGFNFYSSNKVCIDGCNEGDYALIDTKECVPNCNIQIPGEEEGKTYHFYQGNINPVNTCVKNCPDDKPYLNINTCDNSCPDSLPYLDDKICKLICPEGSYYVSNFLDNEEDKQKKCLTDCPSKYPYYVEENNRYLCMHQCNNNLKFYKNLNPEKIGRKCTNECPNTSYKFLSDDEKECLASCPIGKYYINQINSKCMSRCSEGEYLYHKRNEYECKKMSQCYPLFVDYNEQLCVDSCLDSKYKYEEKADEVVILTVCLNSCSDFGKYLTPDNKCISSCGEDNNLEIDELTPYKCKCKYFYYKELISLQIKCLDNGKNCKDAGIYRIQVIDSKECINKCNKILSLNEDYCLNENAQCGFYTKVINESGQKKCECLYKYYFNDLSEKICMGPSEKCPGSRPLYVPTTKQCVQECPSNHNKIFHGFCLDSCPKGAESSSNVCQCTDNKNWYSISDTNFECLPGDCIESHPFLVVNTKQCLEKCKNTLYPHLVDKNKCFSDCNSFPNTESNPIDTFSNDYNFALSTCRCKTPWYFDEIQRKNICPLDNSISSCSDFQGFTFNYMVKTTRQCVISCPSDYPYSFNDECFNSCENEAKLKYNYNVKTNGNSKKCICNNLWKYDVNNNNKIICLSNLESECESDYLQIFDTKQCYKIQDGLDDCPNESPLILNKICYKKNQCPLNSHYDPNIAGKCVCDNLWYLINNKIHCLPKSTEICPDSHPYQIFKTSECTRNCPPDLYIFNYICFESKCPEKTEPENDSSKVCVCDKTKGKWFKYNINNPNSEKYYLYCGLNNCPEIPYKPNLLEEKKQCTYNCDEDGESIYKYAYRGLCYETCPQFTITNDIQKRCTFYNLDNAHNLEELRNYVSVQVKELYEDGPIGGLLYNKFDSSLHIYSIDKNSIDKEIALKSNLSYIDLDSCLNKIYEDQNLNNNDKIFVVKYDLLNNKRTESSVSGNTGTGTGGDGTGGDVTGTNSNINYNNYENYLINQVEYEFYSSRTLNRIQISVCQPKEIIISYPITYNLEKFDNISFGINKNEYREKFQIGKDLNKKNKEIDIFNFNNSVYKDICVPVEINGKDLVLENRYEFLYPNNVSLCENNCTIYYTDYDLERINCKCNYKENFDFNRKPEEISDLLNDPNFNNPTQSGVSGEVIKCLSKFPSKDSIIKNEAFYYCTVVTVAEISMIFAAAFHGLKIVSANISSLMNNPKIKMDIGNKNQVPKNNFKDDNNIITTSQRVLNNPPRKGNNNTNDDKEEKKAIIFQIL